MPLIDRSVLHDLLDEFDAVTRQPSGKAGRERRLDDVLYTICVYTGLRDPREAVARARGLLTDGRAGQS